VKAQNGGIPLFGWPDSLSILRRKRRRSVDIVLNAPELSIALFHMDDTLRCELLRPSDGPFLGRFDSARPSCVWQFYGPTFGMGFDKVFVVFGHRSPS
jgi:hypothetical protein